MIHSVALVIADFLFSKDAITEEEKEVCAYGMELIISGIISVALVLIIGLITGNIWYAVIYNMMMMRAVLPRLSSLTRMQLYTI